MKVFSPRNAHVGLEKKNNYRTLSMKQIQYLFILLAFIVPFIQAEEEREPVVTVPAKYASKLPDCDRVEVFLLGGVQAKGGRGTFPIRPYGQFSLIKKKRELKGDEAKKLCAAWRGMTFDLWSQALCHFPIYGLRFYQGDILKFETSVCFGCSNFYFPNGRGESSWHGFREKDVAGKKLVESLKDIIPMPEKKTKGNLK